MDTARSRPSSPRVAVPRAPSSRARETRAHKTRPRVPLAPHPRATSRAHRATDNPRSGDRGTSSNGSRERLPRRRRRASERERRTLPARMATARCARAGRLRATWRVAWTEEARTVNMMIPWRRVEVCGRHLAGGARGGGVNAYSGVVRADEWKIYVFFGVRVFRVFMVCDEC